MVEFFSKATSDMNPLHFDEDLYVKQKGELIYAPYPELMNNVLYANYVYMKDFFLKTQCRTAIDVGCRYGEYTHYLLKHFAQVKCFEPNSAVLHNFNRNIPKEKVQLWDCGIGEIDEIVDMSGSLVVNKINAKLRNLAKTRSGVQICPLDSFNFSNVDFIKIDVEGQELRVLKGGKTTIMKHRPMIVIEQCGADVKWGYGNQINQAGAYLENIGYVNTGRLKSDYVFEPEEIQ